MLIIRSFSDPPLACSSVERHHTRLMQSQTDSKISESKRYFWIIFSVYVSASSSIIDNESHSSTFCKKRRGEEGLKAVTQDKKASNIPLERNDTRFCGNAFPIISGNVFTKMVSSVAFWFIITDGDMM